MTGRSVRSALGQIEVPRVEDAAAASPTASSADAPAPVRFTKDHRIVLALPVGEPHAQAKEGGSVAEEDASGKSGRVGQQRENDKEEHEGGRNLAHAGSGPACGLSLGSWC